MMQLKHLKLGLKNQVIGVKIKREPIIFLNQPEILYKIN